MKTIALFNHRRGVGKTTLAYHLAWMMQHLGERVLAVDLDPQADLTAAFLDDDEVQALWNPSPSTIYGAVRSLIADRGHASSSPVKAIADGLSLIPGDLTLSSFEEHLAAAWPKGTDRDPSTAEDALRVTTVFHRIIARATAEQSATLAILDLGPSLDALNRAALLAADAVIVPLIIDPTALRGLSALGTKLAQWRTEWTEQQRVPAASGLDLPVGAMPPLGYTVLQLSGADSSLLPVLSELFHTTVLRDASPPGEDPARLGLMRQFQSLLRMARQARKPIFDLAAADGAIGAHAAMVRDAHDAFAALATAIGKRAGIGQWATP